LGSNEVDKQENNRVMEERKEWTRREDQYGENNPYKGLQLSEVIIREAMAFTNSNKSAAKYLKVSYKSYKKYASKYTDPETGKTLFEMHLNKEGRGIKKHNEFIKLKPGQTRIQAMLKKGQWFSEERFTRLKGLLVTTDTLPAYCCACGYDKRRMLDNKIPLVLTFLDDDRTNWELENLQWHCYNCAFHYALPNMLTKLKPSWVRKIVTNNGINGDDITKEQFNNFYNLDDMYYEHLKSIGLQPTEEIDEMDIVAYEDPNKEIDDGSEFIDHVIK
jgi:hypothetical protein